MERNHSVRASTFHMPNGSIVPGTGQTTQPRGAAPLFIAQLQSTLPACGTGCPVDGIPVFTDIFAEDTIANSTYNALEMMLQRRFSHGLQFQAAYTFSKSIDDGSTFEETLDPFNYRASRAPFDLQFQTALRDQLRLGIPSPQVFRDSRAEC